MTVYCVWVSIDKPRGMGEKGTFLLQKNSFSGVDSRRFRVFSLICVQCTSGVYTVHVHTDVHTYVHIYVYIYMYVCIQTES